MASIACSWRLAVKKSQGQNPSALSTAGMTKITKYCRTLEEAERHQATLYNRFDHVRLVWFPTIGEAGQYTWEVQ
jgi:hypothetical protein